VVTNDGELANRLTKASSGVEKTYLVKVAGQPTESELDILRGGVAIERGSAGPPQTGLRLRGAKPGSPQVRTSPARIRQVRQGDNPWYEVVLIEGRNRELRKMFESVGHFVEKIRRVGYGPLVLDQEPGNMRELEPKELDALRKTAEGKLRTPKSKEVRRRNAMDAAGLPTVAPRPTIHPRPAKPFTPRPFEARSAAAGDSRPRKFFAQDKTKPFRPARPASEGFRPAADRSSGRPAWKKDDRPTRRPARFAVGSTGEGRPAAGRPYRDKPVGRTYGDRPTTGRSFGARPASKSPAWKKPAASDRPANKRPAVPRRQAPVRDEDFGPVRPPNLQIEEIRQPDRINSARPNAFRSNSARPNSGKSFRREGGRPRAFTTSSGKPRAGGARPSSNPGVPTDRSSSVGQKSAGRTYGSGPSARPASGPRTGSRPFPGGERKTGTGWKPKTRYGGPNKPAFGVRSKPRPGSSTKSAFKGKPGSKRPGGAFSGKKRG